MIAIRILTTNSLKWRCRVISAALLQQHPASIAVRIKNFVIRLFGIRLLKKDIRRLLFVHIADMV